MQEEDAYTIEDPISTESRWIPAISRMGYWTLFPDARGSRVDIRYCSPRKPHPYWLFDDSSAATFSNPRSALRLNAQHNRY